MNDIREKALEGLIFENENLIRSLANNYHTYSSKDDLYQVGIIGLINAYHNFDDQRGCKFSTYAYPYIDGEMKKYMREDRGIKVSRDIVYLSARIMQAKEIIMQKLRREPTTGELALYLELDESKIIDALQVNAFIKSIDEPINEEGKELTIQDFICQDERIDKLDLIWLRDELSKLSDKEKQLLLIRYFQDRTQAETAEIMHMSQVQVSRGEHRVLERLKNNIYS